MYKLFCDNCGTEINGKPEDHERVVVASQHKLNNKRVIVRFEVKFVSNGHICARCARQAVRLAAKKRT